MSLGALVDAVRAALARRSVLVEEIAARTAELQHIEDELAGARAVLEEIEAPPSPPVASSPPATTTTAPTAENPIVTMIRNNGPSKFNEIADALTMTRSRLREALARLKAGGQIRVTGHTNAARYHLIATSPAAPALDAPIEKLCDLCRKPFPQRSNRQRICVDCRLNNPNRSVEELQAGPLGLPPGWREMLCEGGCGKTIQSNGTKKRCPDCQLQAKRDRFLKQSEKRQKIAETTDGLVDRIRSAPPARHLEAPSVKVDLKTIEARDTAIEEALRRLGCATVKDLRPRFPKQDPAAEDPVALDEAIRGSLTRLRAKGRVGRTADTWSLTGAGSEVAAHA